MAKNKRLTQQDSAIKFLEEQLRRKTIREGPSRIHPKEEKFAVSNFSSGHSQSPSPPQITVIPLSTTLTAYQAGLLYQASPDDLPTERAAPNGVDGGGCLEIENDGEGFRKVDVTELMPADLGQFSVWVRGSHGDAGSGEDYEYVFCIHEFSGSIATPVITESFVIRWELADETLRFYPDLTNFPTTYVKIALPEADWQEDSVGVWHKIKVTWSYQTQEWSLSWDTTDGILITPITPDMVPWPNWNASKAELFTDSNFEYNIYHQVNHAFFGPLQEAGLVGADEKVKVSAADTTADYLADKLSSGAGITLATLNPGGNEQVEITCAITQYTDELAEDAIGNILTDTATIDFTYDDATPKITADVKADSINDTHIDWGVGANQVNTDDIPEGTAKFDTYNVKVSADDTTPGILNGKLTAGSGVAFSELGGGGNETLSISNSLPNINKGHFFAQQAAAITASAYAYMGPTQYSATIGNLMIRAGSITGISASGRITGTTPTCNVRVYKNGVYLTGAEVQITDLDGDVYATFAAGTYTFAAGDELQVYLVIAGTLATLTNLMVDVEYTET